MTNSPWQVRASILIFTSIFVLMQVGYFFQPESNYSPEITSILFGFICFHITGLVIILIILKIQVPAGQRLKELNLPTDHSLLILRQAVVSTVLIIPVIEGILILNLQLMKWLGWTVTENQIGFWLETADLGVIIILVVGAVFLAPVAEELIFRLVLHKALEFYWGVKIANIATSLLFAIIHCIPEQIVPLFVLAMFLQTRFNHTKNLLLPIAIHSLFNGFMVAVALYFRLI